MFVFVSSPTSPPDVTEEGEQFRAWRGHRVLGEIYESKGKTEGPSITSRSPPELHPLLIRSISCFGFISPWRLLSVEGRFNDVHAQIGSAKLHMAKTHTVWLGYRDCRLYFGIKNAGLRG
jgi:hypothetical protein